MSAKTQYPDFISYFGDHKEHQRKVIILTFQVSFFEILFLPLYFNTLSQKRKTVLEKSKLLVPKKGAQYVFQFPKYFH